MSVLFTSLIPTLAHPLHQFRESPLNPAFRGIFTGCLKLSIMGEFVPKKLANTINQGHFPPRHLSAHH